MENVGKEIYAIDLGLYISRAQMYSDLKEENPITSPEEDILLKKIEELNGTDETLEGIYYVILINLLVVEKEDTTFRERLKLAKLVQLLYKEEMCGLIIKHKTIHWQNYEIKKRQIVEIRKVMMKQLSETYEWIGLESDFEHEVFQHFVLSDEEIEERENSRHRKFWENRNPLSWDFERDIIEVIDETGHSNDYIPRKENRIPGLIPITRQGVDKIVEMENEREIFVREKKNYVPRLIWWITKDARRFGYFREHKTIGTYEACILYDTLHLLGLIQGNPIARNDDKKEFIKKEIRKVKDKKLDRYD